MSFTTISRARAKIRARTRRRRKQLLMREDQSQMIIETNRQRDSRGRFLPGHTVGRSHRFHPGRPSANPRGRPWGVNKWTRILRHRRYQRGELEVILTDDHAPPNQREAAIRLLLPYVIQAPPPELWFNPVREAERVTLGRTPVLDLQALVVDPRESAARRAAAYTELARRGIVPARKGEHHGSN